MASSMIIWMAALTACLVVLILGVSAGDPGMLTLAASIICFAIAALAIAENWQLSQSGASESEVAASTTRHMGLVWAWGTIGLLLTYGFILEWKEWLVFATVFGVVAVLCLLFGVMISRDSEAGKPDATMLKLARYLTIVQLVGMIVAMAGLVIDGKIPATVKSNPGWEDWAGNIIFFYGALALVAISANALYTSRRSNTAT